MQVRRTIDTYITTEITIIIASGCKIAVLRGFQKYRVHTADLPGTSVRTGAWGACRGCEADTGSCSWSVADATRARRRRQPLGRTRRLDRRRRPRGRSRLARGDARCRRPPDADGADAPGEHCECCDASCAGRGGGSCGCCDANCGGRGGSCGCFADEDCGWLGTDRRARTNPCTADSGRSEPSGCRGWTCDCGASAVAAIPKTATSCAGVASAPAASSPAPLSRTRRCGIFDGASSTGTRSEKYRSRYYSAADISRM